jgi:hypothetical protein
MEMSQKFAYLKVDSCEQPKLAHTVDERYQLQSSIPYPHVISSKATPCRFEDSVSWQFDDKLDVHSIEIIVI